MSAASKVTDKLADLSVKFEESSARLQSYIASTTEKERMGCSNSKDLQQDKNEVIKTKRQIEKDQAEEASRKLYKNVMQHIPLLSGLSDNELDKLAKGMKSRTIKPGDYLMKEGDVGTEFFIVVKGKCQVSRLNEQGEDVPLAVLENRDYVGEAALVAEEEVRRNATVKAIEKTICLVCDQKTFKNVLQRSKVKFANRNNYRAAVMTTMNEAPEDDEKLDRNKDDDKTQYILKSVSTNLMFENLDDEQRLRIIAKMHREDVEKGTNVIEQGDTDASKFYMVDKGSFNFVKSDEVVGACSDGATFGELALMYNAPRAVTVQATTDATLWVVSRRTFRMAVRDIHKDNSRKNMEFLRSVDLLKSLLSAELALIDAALEEKSYKKSTVLFKQGEKGSRFYIVKKGSVNGTKTTEGKKETFTLKAGAFFGELALLPGEDGNCATRACTIKARSNLVTLELTKLDFDLLLGPLTLLMKDRAQDAYKSPTERKLNTKGIKLKECLKNTIGCLGRGAFGFVTLVEAKGETYALKAVKKCQIVETGQQTHIVTEKKIMSMMNNDFLVNLIATFKDKLRVYFLLDVCLGGELFTILRQRRYFDEPTAQFYAACVVEGFDYMHSMDIIYRDLKPENLVMANNGYLKITDFGFAKIVPEKTYTLCGTPDYLAPEIVTGQGHGKGVDWWTFGVLIYEMLASFPPFFDDDPIQTYRKIIKGRIKYPRYFSAEAKDIVGNLLKLKPTRRLGVIKGGPDNIRNHSWFKKFSWEDLQKQTLEPPIKPKIKDHRDLSNFNRRPETDDDAKPIDPADEFDQDF